MCESDVGERVVWDRSGCKSVVCPRHAWETVCVKELRVKELCGTEVCAKEWCKNVLCVKVLYVQVLWMWWVIMLCSHNRRAKTMSRPQFQSVFKCKSSSGQRVLCTFCQQLLQLADRGPHTRKQKPLFGDGGSHSTGKNIWASRSRMFVTREFTHFRTVTLLY